MRYHVPFEHRNRAPRGPVYIGFEQPVSIQKRKQPFNWFGFSGLLLALVSPFTLFFLAPFALLLSLIGLRRAPRGMAKWGFGLSLVASGILALGIVGLVERHKVQHERHQAYLIQRQNQPLIQQTTKTLNGVLQELRDYRSENQRQLPNLQAGMSITVQHLDAWDQPLRYSTTDYGCKVRSAGPDKEFDTGDDISKRLDGKPEPPSIPAEF